MVKTRLFAYERSKVMKNKNQKNEVVETKVTEEIGTDVAVVEKKSFFGKVKKTVLPSKEDSTLVKVGKVTGIVGVVGGVAYGAYKLASAVFGGSDSEAEDDSFQDEDDSFQDDDDFIDAMEAAEVLDNEGSEDSETEAENVEA
jgi:hypothetical protein